MNIESVSYEGSTHEMDKKEPILSVAQSLVDRVTQPFWQGVWFLEQKVDPYNRIKTAVEWTERALRFMEGPVAKVVTVFDEALDFPDFGGTKDPLTSIQKSCSRLSQHDKQFAECLEFFAGQVADVNAEEIKNKLITAMRQSSFCQIEEQIRLNSPTFMYSFAANRANGVMEMSQDWVRETIKANILHLAANLADHAFESLSSFADGTRNPFGRLLFVVGTVLERYEENLKDLEKLTEEEKREKCALLFQQLSAELLEKIFPKGAEDLQFFHSFLPFTKLAKEMIWLKINQELPVWLERLYHETKPLSEKVSNWQEQFDREAYSFEAKQLVQLPSTLLHSLVRSNGAKRVDDQFPAMKKWMQEQGLKEADADHFAQRLLKYGKEFLLTDDPLLHKMGAFFERYFMEQILYNLSQFVPDDVHSPLLFYILQQWTKGTAFKMFSWVLSGQKSVHQVDAIKGDAIRELLAPFGLDQQETFPLPPSIKAKVWMAIKKFQEEKLPGIVIHAIPEWITLKNSQDHQQQLESELNDLSLTKSIFFCTKTLINQTFDQLTQKPFSIGQKLNGLLPSLVLSEDQQETLDEQWQAFLEDPDSIAVLKKFGKKGVEALALGVCKNLYTHYKVSCPDGVDGEEVKSASFVAWFMLEIIKACEVLTIEGATDQELKALQQAIQLKNLIEEGGDLTPMQGERDELDKAWGVIQPKFDHLTRHLLSILGYACEEDLPFPEQFQPKLWQLLIEHLPLVLFKQMGDLMLPFLEKQNAQEQLKDLPEAHADFIQQGCACLAQDVVSHIPNWVENALLETLMKELTDHHSPVKLTDRAKTFLIETVNDILNVKDPVYEILWQWMESYLEGLLLKTVVKLSQMDAQNLLLLQGLTERARHDLLSIETQEASEEQLPEEERNAKEEAILATFINEFFLSIGIETTLFGLPQALQKPVLNEVKKKIAQGLLGIYHLNHRISHYVVNDRFMDQELSPSEVARAVLGLTRYVLDQATHTLVEENENGEVQGVVQLYDSLNIELRKQEDKGYKLVELFQKAITDGRFTPFLTRLFTLLEGNSAQLYKEQVADWINPILTDQVMKYIVPLLEREQEGQEKFDQAFLMALLPPLTRHLRHINQAFNRMGGLNKDNILNIAGDDLHPALSLITGDQGQANVYLQEKFYKKQTELLFQLIFPNDQEDLTKMLPEVKLSEEQFNTVSKSAQQFIANQLPKALESLFDPYMMVESMSSLLEVVIESLDQPIKIKSSKKTDSLTEAEREYQKEMDELLGELVVESARFIDLPVEYLEKLPEWIKRFLRVSKMEKSMYAAIGDTMREQFDGNLLEKTFQRALPKWAEKEYVKKTRQEKIEGKKYAKEHLKELERELAEKSFMFIFRYLGVRAEQATDIFTHPVIQFLRRVILSVCSFVMVNLVGGTLHFLKIDQLIVNRLNEMIQHTRRKVVEVFSQQDLHENMVFHGVEAVERVF